MMMDRERELSKLPNRQVKVSSIKISGIDYPIPVARRKNTPQNAADF